MITVKLLGRPQIQFQGKWLEPAPSKPLYLLLYAAYNGEWLEREKLSFLLWPEKNEKTAQQNLRRLIFRAKEYDFASKLETEKTRLRWPIKTDLQAFREALAKQDWQSALKLYQGKLLEGFNPKNEAGLEAWLEQERSDLNRVWRNTMHKHIEELELKQEHDKTTPLLYELYKNEPLAEDILQRYLKSAYLTGERDNALSTFKTFKEQLKEELDLDPLEETETLIQTITNTAKLEPTQAPQKNQENQKDLIPLTVLRPPKLMGRNHSIEEVLAATTPAIFIAGEAGIGKSRLMAEVAPQALLIRCQEGLQNIPYYPIISFIRQLIKEGIKTPDLKHYTDDLARLVPEAAPNLTPGPADPETGRSRLFEALNLYFEHVIQLKDLKSIQLRVDDLQWADASTLDLLVYLATKKTIKILCAYRIHEKTKALSKAIKGLNSSQLFSQVTLEPLSQESIQAFIASLMGIAEGPPIFSEWLAKGTGGNPMFMLETLKSFFEQGTLQAQDSNWHSSIDDVTKDYSEIQTPSLIQDLIQRRVENLKPETQRVLQVAAVINQGFTAKLISQISGFSEWTVLDGLEEAETTAIIEQDRFQHDLLRQSIYANLPLQRKHLLHGKVAQQLQTNTDYSLIAEHHFLAESYQEATQFWIKSGRNSFEKGIFDQAQTIFQRALKHSPTATLKQEVEIWLAILLAGSNQSELSLQKLKELHETVEQPKLRFLVLMQYAELLMDTGDMDKASSSVSKAEAILDKSPINDAFALFGFIMTKVKLFANQGHYKAATELLIAELDKQKKKGVSLELVTILTSLGLLLNYQGQHEEANPHHEQAIKLAKELGSNYHYGFAVNNWLLSCIYQDKPNLALQAAEEALALGEYAANELLQNNLAGAYKTLKNSTRALELSLTLFNSTSNVVLQAICCNRIIHLTNTLEDSELCTTFIEKGLSLLKGLTHPRAQGEILLGILNHGTKQQKTALYSYQQNLDLKLLPNELKNELELALAKNL